MSRRSFLFFGLLLSAVLFFSLKTSVSAATLQLQSDTKTLAGPDDEFVANVTLSISTNNTYYLRGVFYKAGTNDYCGYTWNGNSWFNGPYSSNEGWKNFLSIIPSGGSWQGQLKAKIDPVDSGCQTSGTYNFKVERFTSSGSGTFDSQNELTVTVTIPTPTFTPTPTLKPTTPPTPTKAPTATKTPTTSSKSSSSTNSQVTMTPSQNTSQTIPATSNAGVMGVSTSGDLRLVPTTPHDSREQNETAKVLGETRRAFPMMIVIGLSVLAVACGILAFQMYQRQRQENAHEE